MHIKIKRKADCCGCSACVIKCPKQCITLIEDEEGFLYPKVDESRCISCSQCLKVCPHLNPFEGRKALQVISAYNFNETIRLESSSGGMFTLLAERIITQGGIVFGARFDETWNVIIDFTDNYEGLSPFRGSKYVQANTNDTFKKCESFLKSGRLVLYSGTPCQIAGLKHYLCKEYDNLVTIDFVCHGVPSPKVWRLYLSEVQNRLSSNSISDTATTDLRSPITSINFREKSDGWKRFRFVVDFNSNISASKDGFKICECHRENVFMKAFLSDMILRPSCYYCKSKKLKSGADITLGDFWGANFIQPDMFDDKGTSLVLINSKKGQLLMNGLNCKTRNLNYNDAYRSNQAIEDSAIEWPKRKLFFEKLNYTESVEVLIKEMLKPPASMIVRNAFLFPYKCVKRIVNRLVRDY